MLVKVKNGNYLENWENSYIFRERLFKRHFENTGWIVAMRNIGG